MSEQSVALLRRVASRLAPGEGCDACGAAFLHLQCAAELLSGRPCATLAAAAAAVRAEDAAAVGAIEAKVDAAVGRAMDVAPDPAYSGEAFVEAWREGMQGIGQALAGALVERIVADMVAEGAFAGEEPAGEVVPFRPLHPSIPAGGL